MRKTKLTILILFAACFFAKAQSQWKVIGEMERPVSGAQAVVLNNKIYVIGGHSSIEQKTVNWIQEFDPGTNTWKQVGEMKANREGFFVATSSASIFFIGGIEDSSYLYNLEFWNPLIPDTTLITGYQKNFNRIYATGNYNDNKLYLFGGYASPYVNDTTSLSYFVEYDLQKNIILKSDNFNFSAIPSQQMSAIVGNNIYIFGGTITGLLKSIYEYKIDSNEFVRFNSELSSPRAGGAAVKDINSDSVYLIGGYDEGNAALSVVEIFNPSSTVNSIQAAPSLIKERRNPAAVFYEESIFVFGGEDAARGVVKQIEKFDLNVAVGAEELESLPQSLSLKQNYPNPFNPATVIRYELSQKSIVSLKVFNVLGKEVGELLNENKEPGSYEVQFNAEDLTSGVYFYQLRAGNFSETKKMVVLK